MMDWKTYLLAASLLVAPLAAHAQHGMAPHPASQPTAPAPALAPGGEPSADGAFGEEGLGFEDELLAFGIGDEFVIGDDAGMDDGDLADADTPGPDGQRRIVVRNIQRAPGGMGHAGMGAGMQRGAMGGGSMMHRRMGMALRLRLAQLDLTEVQRDKLRDLHEAQARKAIQRRADMQLARMDLHKLMRAERPDPAAVNAQIDKLARMHAEGMKSAFALRLAAQAVLTPEQWKKLHSPMAPGMMQHGMQHEMQDSGEHPHR